MKNKLSTSPRWMERLVRCSSFLLRFGVVFLPLGLAFGVLFTWLKVPQHLIPPLGMPIGSIMMLLFMDFIVTGKFRCGVKSGNCMSRKLMNHADDLARRVPVELGHPGILHRLKRNTLKVSELLRFLRHLLRRPNVILVSGKPGESAADGNREKRKADGYPCLGGDRHNVNRSGLHVDVNGDGSNQAQDAHGIHSNIEAEDASEKNPPEGDFRRDSVDHKVLKSSTNVEVDRGEVKAGIQQCGLSPSISPSCSASSFSSKSQSVTSDLDGNPESKELSSEEVEPSVEIEHSPKRLRLQCSCGVIHQLLHTESRKGHRLSLSSFSSQAGGTQLALNHSEADEGSRRILFEGISSLEDFEHLLQNV